MPNQSQTPEQPPSGARLKAFLTGAIVAASALVGGLAVVLWNRKTLSGLRQHGDLGHRPSTSSDKEREE
jgi:hypothetical protein